MPPPPPAQTGREGTGVVWLVLGTVLLLGLIWYFAHTYLVMAFFFLKRVEIFIFQFFAGEFVHLDSAKQVILQSSPATVPFSSVLFVANEVGNYLRIPIIMVMLLMSMILFSKNVPAKYSRTYSIDSLLKSESEVWPYAKVTMGLDLVHKDIRKGPWAMSMTPLEFAKKYKLLREFVATHEEEVPTKARGVSISLLKSRASRVFSLQLGRSWEGIEALKDHAKALYAAFIAKAARDSEKSANLLRQFAASAAEGYIDLSGVDETISKYKDYPPVVEIMNKHGYVLTVIASMLQLARSDGVLSSAEFVWLKPIDRPLWFMLNAVGRQTPSVEAAGPFAHWLAEKEIGRKLKTPMVDQAVKALDLALQEVRYVPKS